MGRSVVGVAVACGLAATAANAQPTTPPADDLQPIVARPAPPETSWYAAVAPSSAVATPAPVHHAVHRGGLFALTGFSRTSDATSVRLDVGVPTPSGTFRRLRTLLVTELHVGDASTGASQGPARDLALTPELQYDRRLPLELSHAEVVVVLGAGLTWARRWVKLPDEPYWPSSWESSTSYSLRLDSAVQYRADGGLIVSLHPAIVSMPLNTPAPPDTRWMRVQPESRFLVSVVVGYQFR